jgi:hypothetical protein
MVRSGERTAGHGNNRNQQKSQKSSTKQAEKDLKIQGKIGKKWTFAIKLTVDKQS